MEGAPKHKEIRLNASQRVDPVQQFDTLKPQVSAFQAQDAYAADSDARPLSAVQPPEVRAGGQLEGHVPPTFDTFGRQLPRGKTGAGIKVRKGMPGMWHPESTAQLENSAMPEGTEYSPGERGSSLADQLRHSRSGHVADRTAPLRSFGPGVSDALADSFADAGADGRVVADPSMKAAGVAKTQGMTRASHGGAEPRLYSTMNNAPLVPAQWRKKPPVRTQTELHAARRARKHPHISYDLDGDGVVSPMDYFFAAQFDTDQSGVLSVEEKRRACDAMSAGYAQNFTKVRSGVTQSVHHRVLQRRGEVLADDREGGWSNLAKTREGGDGMESKEQRDERLLAKLPYANQGPGGAQQAMLDSRVKSRLKSTAAKHGLSSRSQLMHARRVEEAKHLNATYSKRFGLEALPVGQAGPSVILASSPIRQGVDSRGSQYDEETGPGSRMFTEVPVTDGPVKPHAGPIARGRAQRAAKSRSELLRLRRKSRLVESLRVTGDACEADRVERAPSPVSDDEASLRRTGPMSGLPSLSLSRTELLTRRKQASLQEADSKDRRPIGVGIHGKNLPSMQDGDKPWFEQQRDTKPRDLSDRPWQQGSALDGEEQDVLLRSTGPGVATRRGARVDETTGRPIVRSGIPREAEPDEKEFALKTRTIRLLDMEAYRKKKHLDFAEKPNRVDHWENARQLAATGAPGDVKQSNSRRGGAGAEGDSGGGSGMLGASRSAMHILPSTGGGGLSSDISVGTTKRFSTRRWTDEVLEHRALRDKEEEDHHLDDDGKELYADPKEWAPMYSSFAADRVFRDGWNTRKQTFRTKAVVPGMSSLRGSQSQSMLRSRGSQFDASGIGRDGGLSGRISMQGSGSVSSLGGEGGGGSGQVGRSRLGSVERKAYDGTFGSAAFHSTPAWPGAMKRRGSLHGTAVLLPSQEAAAAAAATSGARGRGGGGGGPTRFRPEGSSQEEDLRAALESRGRTVPSLMMGRGSGRGKEEGERRGASGVRERRRNSVEEMLPPRAPAPVIRSAGGRASPSSTGASVAGVPGAYARAGEATAFRAQVPTAGAQLLQRRGMASSASNPALLGSRSLTRLAASTRLGQSQGVHQQGTGTFSGLGAALQREHARLAESTGAAAVSRAGRPPVAKFSKVGYSQMKIRQQGF